MPEAVGTFPLDPYPVKAHRYPGCSFQQLVDPHKVVKSSASPSLCRILCIVSIGVNPSLIFSWPIESWRMRATCERASQFPSPCLRNSEGSKESLSRQICRGTELLGGEKTAVSQEQFGGLNNCLGWRTKLKTKVRGLLVVTVTLRENFAHLNHGKPPMPLGSSD